MSGKRYSAFPSSFIPELAEGAARFLFERRNDIDAIVISGDLATTGRSGDLDVAFHFVDSAKDSYLASNIASIGFARERILLLPGNHDRYTWIGTPGSATFDLKFQNYWKVRRPHARRKVFTKDDHNLVIIAADFSLIAIRDAEPPTPWNVLGQGKVYRDALRELEDKTSAAKIEFPGCGILWAVHFPPVVNCAPYLRLLDFELLVEASGRHEVQIMLCGHLHSNATYGSAHGMQVVCAASFCSCEDEDNQWLHIIDLEVSANGRIAAEKTDFRWSDDMQEFVEIDTGIKVCA